MTIPATLTAQFERLRVVLAEQQYTDIQLFDLIGQFARTSPVVSAAICFHVVDILREAEEGQEVEYADLTIEAYRRTFFDAEGAAKYGTDSILVTRPEVADSFVTSIIYGFKLGDAPANDLTTLDMDGAACH